MLSSLCLMYGHFACPLRNKDINHIEGSDCASLELSHLIWPIFYVLLEKRKVIHQYDAFCNASSNSADMAYSSCLPKKKQHKNAWSH